MWASRTAASPVRARARGPAPRVGYALVFLAGLLLAAPAAAEPVLVRAAVGWDGWVRLGAWNPLQVQVEAAVPLRGWLVVDVPQEFGTQHLRLRPAC